MAVEIKIPSLGESISEVVVATWLKGEGDYVEKNEPIIELETDKVNQELPAPEAGILRPKAKEGDTLKEGDVAGVIEPGEPPDNGRSAKQEKEERGEERRKKNEPEKESDHPEPAEVSAKAGSDKKRETKEARKPDSQPAEVTTARKKEELVEGTPSRSTSVARKLADEFDVNLDEVKGTGPGGRITREDVLAYLVENHRTSGQGESKPSSGGSERKVTRERLSQLRRKIAARLVQAQQSAAMLTTFNEADMSAVMKLRADWKEAFEKKHGVGLGLMSFFVRAAVEALRAYPRVNAFIDGDEIEYHHYHDIGVAVGTDRGLVVPVLRNVESMSFADIERAIREYAEKAKSGKLTLDDLSGGTFTISNGGVYGSMMSTPILNPPQSAILGMHNIMKRPVAVGDQVQIRPMMYLALSYDHRIIDGKEAVGFLLRIKECIESPGRMLIEV